MKLIDSHDEPRSVDGVIKRSLASILQSFMLKKDAANQTTMSTFFTAKFLLHYHQHTLSWSTLNTFVSAPEAYTLTTIGEYNCIKNILFYALFTLYLNIIIFLLLCIITPVYLGKKRA